MTLHRYPMRRGRNSEARCYALISSTISSPRSCKSLYASTVPRHHLFTGINHEGGAWLPDRHARGRKRGSGLMLPDTDARVTCDRDRALSAKPRNGLDPGPEKPRSFFHATGGRMAFADPRSDLRGNGNGRHAASTVVRAHRFHEQVVVAPLRNGGCSGVAVQKKDKIRGTGVQRPLPRWTSA